ncbi:YfhO family protein [Acetitomaculum ruminis]|nr:YfhO family protein [Acetitomaculum ruminis]
MKVKKETTTLYIHLTVPGELSSVEYYVSESKEGMPYGYSLTNAYKVYKNDYALPVGYCYDKYISKKSYDSLDSVQKQEIQMEAVCLEDEKKS